MKTKSPAILFAMALFFCLVFACKKTSSNNGTCSDGIKNQNETNIDCGGVCSVCATCSDGIQNQNETGIDCGGPCGACPFIYAGAGNYGVNVLQDTTTTFISSDRNTPYYYSFRAEVTGKTSLKVVFKVPSNGQSSFMTINTSSIQGWGTVGYDYPPTEVRFFADGPVTCDMAVSFSSHNTGTLEFYVNGSATPMHTKSIRW